MIGIIPSIDKTFNVDDYFNTNNPIEGNLYIDTDGRVYMYSTKYTRSNPENGYFPIWDGKEKYITQFSNIKFLNKDVIKFDISTISSNIDSNVANEVIYKRKRTLNNDILRPVLVDGDNMFTQCIKSILNIKDYSLIDLEEMSFPKLQSEMISSYYSALTKITFMRLDKWLIWINVILHLKYDINVYDNGKLLLIYKYPTNEFILEGDYSYIINNNDDFMKKIIKIIMSMKGITKNDLRSDEIDDYTINNMMTTINGNKSLSSQIFSRFIRISNLSYDVILYEKDNVIFTYSEF